MAQISSTKCNTCEENVAKVFCYDCQSFLCASCEKFHSKLLTTKKHNVIDSQRVDRSDASIKYICEKHESGYAYYCEECKSLICHICVTSDHKNHPFEEMSTVTAKARQQVNDRIETLTSREKTLSDLIDHIKSVQLTKLERDENEHYEEVKKISTDILDIVTDVKQKNINIASDFYVLERQTLNFVLSKLERSHSEHSSLLNKLGKLENEKHDIMFFIHDKALQKELEDLDEIPKTEEPQQMETFKQDDFVDLVIEHIQSKYHTRSFQEVIDANTELRLQLQQEQERSISLQKETGALGERLMVVERQLKSKDDEYEHLLTRFQQNSDKSVVMERENDAKNCRIQELMEEIASSRRSIQAVVDEKEEIYLRLQQEQQKSSSFQKENDEKEERLKVLKIKIADSQIQLKSKDDEYIQLLTRFQQTSDKSVVMERENDAKNCRIQELMEEIASSRKQLKSKQDAYEALFKRFQKNKKYIDVMAKEMIIFQKQETSLTQSLSAKENEVKELSSRYHQERAIVDALVEQNTESDEINQELPIDQSPTGNKSTWHCAVAIRFGTKHTSYVITFGGSCKDSLRTFLTSNWCSQEGISSRTTTSILLTPKKQFACFGFVADERYTELVASKEHHNWYYFKWFTKEIKKNIVKTHDGRKELPATTVISLAIGYLMKTIIGRVETVFDQKDIRWVLTASSKCSKTELRLLREAALKTGINYRNLLLVKESDATFMYCSDLQIATGAGEVFRKVQKGNRFSIINCADDYLELSVYQVQKDNLFVTELFRDGFQEFGWNQVCGQFRQLLIKLIGSDVLSKFHDDHPWESADMYRRLETKALEFQAIEGDFVLFKMPILLKDKFEHETNEKFNDVVKQSMYSTRLMWVCDKLKISKTLFSSLLDIMIGTLISFVTKMLKKQSAISDLIFVGDVFQSGLLQNKIEEAFPHINVYFPEEMCVEKGANIFGLTENEY